MKTVGLTLPGKKALLVQVYTWVIHSAEVLATVVAETLSVEPTKADTSMAVDESVDWANTVGPFFWWNLLLSGHWKCSAQFKFLDLDYKTICYLHSPPIGIRWDLVLNILKISISLVAVTLWILLIWKLHGAKHQLKMLMCILKVALKLADVIL